MVEKYRYPSQDLTYEWGRVAPEQLSKEASTLDTKIMGIFAVACIMISAIVSLVGKIQFDITLTPFGIAFICFIIIFVKSLLAFGVKWFFVADDPKILKKDYWVLEPDEAKEKYWKHVEKTFEANLMIVRSKGQALKWTVPLLALETIFLVAWLLLISYLNP